MFTLANNEVATWQLFAQKTPSPKYASVQFCMLSGIASGCIAKTFPESLTSFCLNIT
jgi:hypothetical protein